MILFLLLVSVCLFATVSKIDSFIVKISNSHYTAKSGIKFRKLYFRGVDGHIVVKTEATVESLSPCPKPSYYPRNDQWWEKLMILGITFLLSKLSKNEVLVKKNVFIGLGFSNFVAISKDLLRNSTAESIKNSIVALLRNLMPDVVRHWFQSAYSRNPRYICESSSLFMSFGLLEWLVGPVERFWVKIPPGERPVYQVDSERSAIALGESTGDQISQLESSWHSGVKLKECRYLSEASCKAACLYLCRQPTHAFFNDVLQVPMYMKPNFTDCSCEMFFGLAPPDPAVDEVYGESCFKDCSMRQRSDDFPRFIYIATLIYFPLFCWFVCFPPRKESTVSKRRKQLRAPIDVADVEEVKLGSGRNGKVSDWVDWQFDLDTSASADLVGAAEKLLPSTADSQLQQRQQSQQTVKVNLGDWFEPMKRTSGASFLSGAVDGSSDVAAASVALSELAAPETEAETEEMVISNNPLRCF